MAGESQDSVREEPASRESDYDADHPDVGKEEEDEMSAGETIQWGVILLASGLFLFFFAGDYCLAIRVLDVCWISAPVAGAIASVLGGIGLVIGISEL